MVVSRSTPPKKWTDPRRYKPLLRRNFRYTCAYSWVHERPLGGEPTFEVEHFRPECGWPDLRSEYSNLYYVWGPCNRRKGSTWPTPEEAAAGIRLIDPCQDCVLEHFAYQVDRVGNCTGKLIELSSSGRYTIDTCDLNSRVLRDIRRETARGAAEQKKAMAQFDSVLSGDLSDEHRARLSELRAAAQEVLLAILYPKPQPADADDE